MTEGTDKRSFTVATWLVPLLLIVLLVLQMRFWFGPGSLHQVSELEGQVSEQEALNAEILARNQEVAGQVQSLREGNEAIELAARREFGMVRQGETFYLLVDDAPAQ